jgi:Fe2+ transport system protein FeoA
MSALSLADLPVGGCAKIASFNLPEDIRLRLMEMGLTKGAICTLVRFAPMGDPIEIKVRGFHLSLRKTEAQGIEVTPQVQTP